MQKEIVVIQAGWVVMGDVEETPTGVTVHGASVIRNWGTTKGLGEIAIHGPTKSTTLDPAGELRVPTHAVLMRIICKS